mgnify:CR=1 FL=1
MNNNTSRRDATSRHPHMDKTYSPPDIEQRIYDRWEQAGCFATTGHGTPYSIVISDLRMRGLFGGMSWQRAAGPQGTFAAAPRHGWHQGILFGIQGSINIRTRTILVSHVVPVAMTLDQLRVLVKVVDAGSFTAAADVLGVQRSHVSRVIAQLEAELGVTLLERTTRRQSVSEAGRAVYERAVGVLAAIEDTVRVTQDLRAQPQGHLRITCGVAFGIAAVGGWVETFLARHPQCTAEIEYASRELDLVHEGFDLAIRAGPLPDSRLAAKLQAALSAAKG